MRGTTRRAEFFVVEAEEYLLDLELVASAHEAPDTERLVRGARALRGAALVAGLGTFARVAAGIEALARQLRSGTLEWDGGIKQQSLTTITSLKALLPRASAWDAAADAEAMALAERIERFAGRGPQKNAVAGTQVLTAGVRAFIAKESALIASALERAARALSPMAPSEALAAVLERMRSLRGLGASADLSPLPEMLDAMEIATRTLLGDEPPPPDVSALFDEAARALAAMARAIAENGQVVVPAELDQVAAHLLSAYAEEPDVVAVSALAPDGEASVLHQGTAPAPPPDSGPVPIELVGVGDHLLLIADTLARPNLAVVRDLRLFVLHRTLATMPPRSSTGQFLAPLTRAINEAIGRGIAGRQLDGFITMLRDFGRFLIDSGGTTDLGSLVRERDRLVVVLLRGELGAAIHAPRVESLAPISVVEVGTVVNLIEEVELLVPIQSLAPDEPIAADLNHFVVAREESPPPPVPMAPVGEPLHGTLADDPIVDIRTLLVDPHTADESAQKFDEDLIGTPIVPIEALSFDAERPALRGLIPQIAPGDPSRLEVAWRSLGKAAAADVSGEPSLDHLLEQDILPIDTLLYRGPSALARAAEVNVGIVATLREPTASLDGIRGDLEELMDLVALAHDASW